MSRPNQRRRTRVFRDGLARAEMLRCAKRDGRYSSAQWLAIIPFPWWVRLALTGQTAKEQQ